MNGPMKYRKKPVVIEAMQWHADRGVHEAMDPVLWMDNHGGAYRIDAATGDLFVVTLEGEMRVDSGDWIIKEPNPTDDRKFYPCKPDIFEATYEQETP